jgi:hypothetical protein
LYVLSTHHPPIYAFGYICSSPSALLLLVCVLCCCSDDKYVKPEAAPKIPTAKDAAKHKAGGGNVKICTLLHLCHRLMFAAVICRPLPSAAVASLRRLICIYSFSLSDDKYQKPVAAPKIPTAKDAAKHKAGGGNVKICTY